jgi:UDP-galactopyranose mutase
VGDNERIVIIGAGPTGLAAAHRLRELGNEDFVVLEASKRAGGLARSITDAAGFTWDIGGHVMFSHYDYYDRLVERLMGGEHTTLDREAWVRTEDRFIRYPYQNNIRDLPPQTVFDCLAGAMTAQREAGDGRPANFREWIYATMGAGIADHFMIPYNYKVWATPAELMNYAWIGERVSVVDAERLLRDVLLGQPAKPWGPNSTFRYPLHGGTGFLFDRLAEVVADRIEYGADVVRVDPRTRVVRTRDDREFGYDVLLSTMPVNRLVAAVDGVPGAVTAAAEQLSWSGTHVVGIGVDRPVDSDKNWIYFPEPDVPFYRVTYLSNYSPHLTARPGQFSLLTETSWSRHKREDPATIVGRVVAGLIRAGLLDAGDRDRIVSRWRYSPAMSYPVPTTGRDAALGTIQPWLREQRIYSRGRFGAWLYEIGNMDHSAMQGVEFADHVLRGSTETVWIPRGERQSVH